MAGGNFVSMNKVLPGAYLNFVSIPRPLITVGDRGIATMPMELNWGEEGKLIEVLSEELLGTKSLAKVGFTAFDDDSKLLNIMLKYCYKALVYRTNTGGEKAKVEIGEEPKLTVTAKYSGTFGNKIQVQVVENGELFDVSTFVDGAEKDKQTVSNMQELEANDFVTFSGEGTLTANAGVMLAGGTNGTTEIDTAIPAYLELLKTAKFQTAAFPQVGDDKATLKSNIATFVENQRDGQGRYIQAVLANYPQANYEGIISNTNGAIINGVTFTKEELTACIAGMTAGANINESITNKTIEGATDIVGLLDEEGLKKALGNGELVLAANQDGSIKIVRDINSYHTFTVNKNKEFSKNRVIRVFDEIGTSIKDTWEKSYMGKVTNNANYRAAFKGDIDAYFKTLEGLEAIQEYVSSGGIDNLTVEQGDELDIVVVNVSALKPADSMEFLYMTVRIKVS